MKHWRTLLPWVAVAGAALGFAVSDYVLVFLAVLLLAGAWFWRPPPGGEENGKRRR